ncbi:hypothetical protein, partial [uncultured Akkermansia sp.]|uniref:hypothetical protein n=1 Tax=uncultured Akkermansia sp. TaxID=512294 RepID=UPI00265CD7AC
IAGISLRLICFGKPPFHGVLGRAAFVFKGIFKRGPYGTSGGSAGRKNIPVLPPVNDIAGRRRPAKLTITIPRFVDIIPAAFKRNSIKPEFLKSGVCVGRKKDAESNEREIFLHKIII